MVGEGSRILDPVTYKPRLHHQDTDSSELPDHYTPDGTHNHPLHTTRGSLNSPRIRQHPPLHSYIDTGSDDEPVWHHPRLDLPSARRILVELFHHVPPRKNEKASQLLMAFGHFVVRDVTRSESERDEGSMPIECDFIEFRGHFCQRGELIMEFNRVARSLDENASLTGEPVNTATAWLDLDQMYGNALLGTPDYLTLRTGEGGKMKLDPVTGLPPIGEDGQYLHADPTMRRLPADLALCAIFSYYHNERAEHWAAQHPEMTDEELFWKARMDTCAVYQAIWEDKYLTALLGDPLETYTGYDESIDGSIDVFFSTSSFRYGHSGMSGIQRMLDDDWQPTANDPLLMRDIFNQTEALMSSLSGNNTTKHRSIIASMLRGLSHDVTRAPDGRFVDDMALFMNAPVAKNVQRGRDNGLPSYNDAREWFGLGRRTSYLDLSGGDEDVARRLENLYGPGNIDDVDAYVGAMIEKPSSEVPDIGPLNKASLTEQFTRLRDGDRLYYRNRMTRAEIEELPTLDQLILEWSEGVMSDFPTDTFAIVDTGGIAGSQVMGTGGMLSLFDGEVTVQWDKVDEDNMEFTLTTMEKITGGYVGVGWGSPKMKGSDIWFCSALPETGQSDESVFEEDECIGSLSCCVAPGKQHIRPVCDEGITYLTVIDSCTSSNTGSNVTVRAKLCSSVEDTRLCFSHHDGDAQFIVAYNPVDANAAHGFSRRTSGAMNLVLGTAATCSDVDSAQAGIFALHGGCLLFAWLVVAPVAIYIVRYMKTKPWRIAAHISLVGLVGGLMLPLVTAALVSVEGTGLGTTDADGTAWSKHKRFGVAIVCFLMFMIFTGELRRRRTVTQATKSLLLERTVIISHRCGGLLLTGMAWYNCYGGLIQIAPYESDSLEVTLGSTATFSLGYDLEFFDWLKKYIYFPWITAILLVFLITEIKIRRSNHVERIRRENYGCILNIDNEKDLPNMSIDSFLFLTKHGSMLSIIDGYVIDISTFANVHPGGTNVLRYAVGVDIGPYFVGEIGVSGQIHTHSPDALKVLKPLVKWKLEIREEDQAKRRSSITRFSISGSAKHKRRTLIRPIQRSPVLDVFRNATVMDNSIITSENDTHKIIRLRIILKKDDLLDSNVGFTLPSSTFLFRAIDRKGEAYERPYSVARCFLINQDASVQGSSWAMPPLRQNSSGIGKNDQAIVYEFFIKIVPRGKMTTHIQKKKAGKHLLIKGPLVDRTLLGRIRNQPAKSVFVLAQGTGIIPILHFVDCQLKMPNCPKVTLLWLVQHNQKSMEGWLNLEDRNPVYFKYFIAGKNDDGTMEGGNKFFAGDAGEAFLCQYRAKGIEAKESIDALLRWIIGYYTGLPIKQDERESDKLSCQMKVHSEHVQRTMRYFAGCTDLIFAVCGHSLFEMQMFAALTTAGMPQEQLFRFEAGSDPLSKVQDFVTQKGATVLKSDATISGPVRNASESGAESVDHLEHNSLATMEIEGDACSDAMSVDSC